jgi:hypothetical protein
LNWEAISAVGEILGAAAVVATLLFVAREIRQNHRALSVAALRDTTAQWNHWSEMMATSKDLADIVVRGNQDYSALSSGEAMRYGAYVKAFFDNVESYRSLVTEHRLDRNLDVLIAITARRLRAPGFRAWWEENTEDYADGFVAWVEAIIVGSEPSPD